MPEQHAKLSASGAKKWLNCPGSILLEENEPNKSTSYSSEGTTAHTVGELKLRLALKEITKAKYAKAVKDLEIPKDMDGYTNDYRDFVTERFNKALEQDKQSELLLEQRLDFSKWVPDGFGTGDAVIISNDYIEIIDLKYGKGVKIEAENNPQCLLYALGAFDEHSYLYNFKTVYMTIYQPRIDNIDSCSINVDELLAWGEEIKAKAKLANSGTRDCVAGKHCDDGFCRARAKCRVYNEEKLKLAKSEFKMPSVMSNEEIAEILELAPRLKNWAKMVEDYALDKAMSGEEFPGYKVVEGRSKRKYTNEDTVINVLTDNGYCIDDVAPRQLITITNMEKKLSKEDFNELLGDLIVKPKGAPTLVPLEDKRPLWNSAEEDFKDEFEKEIN